MSKGSKSFQKKVLKSLRDFFLSERVQSFVEDIEEDDEIKIFRDPDCFEDFDENLDNLMSIIDRAFKYCSRTRRKKSESLELNEEIRNKLQELIQQNKNENFSLAKRGRDESVDDEQEQPNKKRGIYKPKPSTLTNEEKAKLKDMANRIAKDPEAEPFLYPVDKRVFPVYYEVIEQPMDLTTWKKKINDYTTLKMALDDLRLVWTNCAIFNAEGSDINNTALRLGLEAEATIETYFGKSETDSTWKSHFKGVKIPKVVLPTDLLKDVNKEDVPSALRTPKGERKKRKLSLPELASISITDMKNVLKTLMEDDRTLLFRTPVTDDVAPGYSDLISEPMDLSTIKKKLRSHSYNEDALAMIREVRLVWSNCQEYNAPGSDIFNLAVELEAEFESKLKDIVVNNNTIETNGSVSSITEIGVSSKSNPALTTANVTSTTKSKAAFTRTINIPSDVELKIDRVPANQFRALSANAVQDLLSMMKTFPDIASFLKPVQEEDAPGYFDVINTPMDVGTIERKLMLGSYHNNPSDFVEDVRLMWRNCLSYSLHESASFKAAINNSQQFEDSLRIVLKKDADKIYENAPPPKLASSDQLEHSEDEEEDNGDMLVDDDEELELSDQDIGKHDSITNDGIVSTVSSGRKKRIYCSFRVRKYRHILRLLSMHELATFFLKLPESDHEYFQKVEQPLDLTMIRNRITDYQDIPLGFLSDLKQVFDNWISFSPTNSDVYVAATIVKNFVVDIFYQNFLSLSSFKTLEDEQCIVDHRSSGNKHTVIDEPHRKRHRDEIGEGKSSHDRNSSVSGAQSHNHIATPSTDLLERCDVDLPSLFPKITKLEYANRINELNAFESGQKAAQSDLFRQTAHSKAVQLLKDTKLPYIAAPSLYEVTDFGVLQPAVSSSRKALYPIRYEVLRIMRLSLVPEESGDIELKDYPYVSLIFKSRVSTDTETERLLFLVELDNGIVVGKGRSAKEAWTDVLTNSLAIVRNLGNKLQRCRAVFNRVCVSPDCVPFLEQVPLDMNDYYAVIKSPMWLREIHNRLSEGTYDNEFDFAWDMRLIFRNCKEFNVSNSALYKQADRLSNLFEQLFVAWVINVQDASVSDVAKGEWTDWMDLRYFNTKSGAENVCKISGRKAPITDLLQCQFCEDYYLPSSVGLPASRAHSKSKWGCARCTHAFELGGNNLGGDPFPADMDSPYPASNIFVPVAELGVGWLQARRKRGGLKNLFLSPLGYEILSKDLIDTQKEFENTVDKELLVARAKEFQETTPGKPTKSEVPRSRGGRYRSPMKESKPLTQNVSHNTPSGPIDAKYLEHGRIVNGKLANFNIPSGYCFVFCSTANEADVVASTTAGVEVTTTMLETLAVCTVDSLPEYGFFGFQVPEIRSRLEGLDGALECKTYEFATYNENIKEDMIATMRRKVDEAKSVLEAEEKLKNILLNERWQYEQSKLLPRKPTILNSDKGILQSFRKLFPVKQFEGLDIVVCVWEFLHACKSLGYVNFTLADVVSSTQPCGQVHNIMQTVFDEISCIFTEFLFQEIKQRHLFTPLNENRWQDICMVYPINSLTWPKVLEKVVFLLAMPLTLEEADLVLTHTCGGSLMIQFKLLCLLYNHPLIDEFVKANKECTHLLLATLRRAVIDRMTNLSTAYIGIDDFSSSILKIFASICDNEASWSETSRKKAKLLENWLIGLMQRMGLLEKSQSNNDEAEVSRPLSIANFDVCLESDRCYGGFSLARKSQTHSMLNILLPKNLHVHTPLSDHETKEKALLSLERFLFMLNSSETEFWSPADRIHLYHVLVDLGMNSMEFQKDITVENRNISEAFKSFRADEIDVILSEAHTKTLTNVPRVAVCHFTGISYSMVPEASKWTVVPPEYLRPDSSETLLQSVTDTAMDVDEPTVDSLVPNSNFGVGKRRGRDSIPDGQVYALKEALSRVIHCRRLADIDKGKYVELMGSVVQKSFFPQFDLTFKNSLFARSQPLGYDSAGNVYWLFHVQGSMTLFPFDEKARSLDPTDVNTSEPCILMQDTSGTWYYCSSKYLAGLLQHLSDPAECEQLLRLRLIEKFYILNRSIRLSTLDIKPLQLTWLQRKMQIESWATEQTMYQGPNELHKCRMLEVLWARTAEARMHIYYAYLFKLDDEVERGSERAEREALLRKQRRIKEDAFDEVFDLNSRRGWNRLDYYTRLRQLAAVTTATTIHFDPNVPKTMAAFIYSKSPFLVRHSWADVEKMLLTQGMVSSGGTGGNNDNDEDDAQLVSTSKVTRSQVEKMDVDEKEVRKEEGSETADNVNDSIFDDKAIVDERNIVDKQNRSSRPLAQHFDRVFETASTGVADESRSAIVDSTQFAQQYNQTLAANSNVVVDGPANVLHVNVPSYDGTHVLPPRSTKAVEQLHILTGEILRLHASGKHAAQFFDLSQSGISQCLTTAKTDCYGFRWRYYLGPPVDFQEIEDKQTPLEALTVMQNDKHSIELFRRWCGAGNDPTACVPDPSGEAVALMHRVMPPGVGGQYLMDAIQKSAIRLSAATSNRYQRPGSSISHSSSTNSLFRTASNPTIADSSSGAKVPPLHNASPVVGASNSSSFGGSTGKVITDIYTLPLAPVNPHAASVFTASAALENDPNASYYAFPALHQCKNNLQSLPPIVTSTKYTCAKLVKLKGELFNIMYSFPEKALKWPMLDEISEQSIAKAGDDAAKSTAEHQRNLPNPPSEEDIQRMADKNARKIKRRMRRKMAIEQFALTVQAATTAQELLRQVLLLEAAVPLTLTFQLPAKSALPVTAATVAEVAQRLYAFDRSIAYDTVSNIDTATLNCPFRLRTQFVPRCHVHAFCVRYLGHTGKCQTVSQNLLFSRLPDHFQLAPPSDPFSNQKNQAYRDYGNSTFSQSGGASASHSAGISSQRPAYQRPSNFSTVNMQHNVQSRVEVMPRLALLVEKPNPDIEKEQGYVPINSEITSSIWL